jgi:glycosyltransferase Alg8
MLSHICYILVCLGIALIVPGDAIGTNEAIVLTIGFIGAWRYGWGLINFVRAQLYVRWAYPNRRDAAAEIYAMQPRRAHAYFLVTSYNVGTATSVRVYRSIFEAAARSEGGATVVASVVETEDERLIRSILGQMAYAAERVSLIIDKIPATGKRDALATSLNTIGRQHPGRGDIVLFVDGDTIVPDDIVARTAPFFCDPAVGAVTTDEDSEVIGSQLFQDWFSLRFTQRQMMMSSMALGGRVLTLTGRMSVFRAVLAIDPSFIAGVQSDYIDHWRLGRINFLTGDDKSTWFWLLSRGFRMLYLPDVRSISLETQPKPSFTASANTLMVRWFGNMLRTNGRALRLSPFRIGLFTWWSILDQRVSMWTTLTGPVAVLLATIFVDPYVLLAYIAWVMATRYINCWLLATFRGPFPITYPFLLYYAQIAGAVVKTYVLFRLDRQRWTRQASSSSNGEGWAGRVRSFSSTYMHALSLVWLVVGVLALSSLALVP